MLSIPGSGGHGKACGRRSRSTHMSMSEFEEQFHSEGDNLFSLSITEPSLPADFSEEDVAFAQELSQLFSPEKEELPPFFVQTLLEAEDPRYIPLGPLRKVWRCCCMGHPLAYSRCIIIHR